ncbi:paraquat-inducible protein A [Aureococcus anophagefferens]|nr:paraquat-inducible protein A [Aureococcus anophagefferens]
MKINVPSRYEDTFSGVKIKVSDMQCEDLVVGAMAAAYEAPRSLAFRFDGIEASCEGDYDWKYESWVGNIKGDGKLRASIHRTSAAFTVTINADDWGAPTELVTADCAMDLAVDDVDVRGDHLEEYVYANVGSLLKDAGLQNCECCDRDGVAPFDDDAMDAAPRDAWVDWHGFFANASGPGARAARDVNAARKSSGTSTGDVFGILLDAAADAGAALAGPDPLVVNGSFDLLAERDAPSRGDDDDGAAASDDNAWNATEATYVYVRSSTQRTDECLEVDAFGSALCVFVRGRVDDLPVLASYADAVAPGAALRCLSLSGAAYVVADCETAGSLDAAGAEDALSYAAGMESALVEFFLEDLTDETTGRLCWTVDRGSAAAADDGGARYVTTAVCDAFFDDLGNASRANATDLLWSFAALGGAVTHDATGYCLDTRGSATARNARVVARPPPCDAPTAVWRLETPADYYETHAAGDDDWDWRWEAVEHAASGLCVDVQSGSTAPGATLQLYDCNGGTAQTFSVVEYFEKVDKRLGVSGPDMFANASLLVGETVVTSALGPLAAIPRDRLRAYARTDGATDDAAALGLGLPADAAFHAETTMSVRFAFGDLGEWIVQRSGSPLLDFRLDLALDVWALAVDVILALGVDANATKAGVGAWEVGDAFSLDCLRTALRIQDARFDWIYVNYTRTPVDVVASTFAARRGGDLNYDLEDDVAATIIPATVDLIEHGFWDFSHCAVDEFVRTDGRSGPRRRRGGPSPRRRGAAVAATCAADCAARPDWAAAEDDGALVALNESSLARRVARYANGFDVAETARSLATYAAGSSVASYDDEPDAVSGTARDRFRQRVARDDDHLIVVAKEAEAVRISVMATTLRFYDVFIADADRSLANLTLFPGGASALETHQRFNLAEARVGYDAPPDSTAGLSAGLSVDVESPLGDASIAFNVTFERVRLDDFEVEAWVDGSSLNALSGDDLGLGEVFSSAGSLSLECLAASLEGVRVVDAPKLHVGSVRARAWSDRENIDGVVESAVQSAAFLIGEYADAADMRTELVWLFNDVLDARLADVKDACVAQRPGAPVADRRDVRGERPTAKARRDAEGFHGGLKLTYEMLTVVGLLASMFLSFGLIWAKRRARPAVRRALRKRARDPKPSADGLAVPGLRDAAFDDEAKAASDDDVLADRDGSFVVEEAVGDATANDELGGYRRPRRPSLIAEAPLPRPLKALLLLVMVCNTGLLVASNVSVAAEVRLRLKFYLEGAGEKTIWVDTGSKFSLAESVEELWHSGSYLLALLIALLSGAWPYLEIFLLIWGYTRSGLDPRTREKVWRTVEMLSKWSFIDVFTVVFLVVAFYVHAPIDAPGASFDFETFVEMRTGFYAFCVATLTSMALGQVVLYLHREVHHYGRRFGDESDRVHDARSLPKGAPAAADGDDGVHDARSLPEGAPAAADGDDDAASDGSSDGGDRADEELASLKTSIVEMLTPEDRSVDDDDIFPRMEPVAAAARCAPLRSHRYKGRRPRWWQAAVAPLFAGVFAMLAYAFTVDVIRFEVGGAAGFLIDETRTGEATRDYSAAGAIFALRGCTPEDGWRPLVRFLTWVSAIFAFLIPLAHCVVLVLLYGVPLPPSAQSKLLAAADVLYGWSSLDVFVVSVVAAATQFGDVATSLAKDECKDVDGLLATFFDSTLGDDASCFTLALEVLDGCFLLTLACLFHMVAGHLAGNVTAAAVAERLEEAAATAEAPAPPPRSALELVAQKDGDVAI